MTKEEAIIYLDGMRIVPSENWKELAEERNQVIDMAIEALQDRPSGEWLNRESLQVDEDAYDVANCSECGAEITLEYPHDNFCPNCGARMERR